MSQSILSALADVLESRRRAPIEESQKSYVASLYHKGTDAILKKVGEEATEVIIAAKSPDDQALVHEVADLWFHCMVMLANRSIRPEAVLDELARRQGLSGLEEKAARQQKRPDPAD